jgi:hypothetical protein
MDEEDERVMREIDEVRRAWEREMEHGGRSVEVAG